MNNYGKIALLACGVAVASSAATMAVFSAATNTDIITDSVIHDNSSSKSFLKVVQRPGVETDFTKAAESTINGVVSIKSYVTPRNSYRGANGGYFDPFEFFFGSPGSQRRMPQREREQQEPQQMPTGLGSGVVISSDGYIVTNNHVIDGAERLEVTLNDNRTFNAEVIGTDPATDLGLIKIDATDLPTIPIGDSDALKVGEWVLAVGNPFGFTSTVTTGIVSAKARSISALTSSGRSMGIESYIQTDAAVNPGNSGGALVNIDGELVGINTAIYSQTGNYAGYSFAIPTTIVTKVVTDLKQYGTVQRAVLGVEFRELNSQLAKEKDITAVNDGLYIENVIERSSAMEAGLKHGDVITSVNGVKTHNGAQLQEQMSKYRPGDKITVSYIRDNKKHDVKVTLLNNQGSTKITQASTVADLGCAFKAVDDQTKRQLRISGGLQVVGLKDGKFKDAGIKEGFIILDINNARVNNPDDVDKIYNSIMKSDEYDKVMFITGLYPTGKKLYYAVDLSD